MINTDYLIGLPSGQIIDIHQGNINNLKQEGLIGYNDKLMSYVFKDDLYDTILRYLNRNNEPHSIYSQSYIDKVADFFDKQKNVRSYIILGGGLMDVSGSIYISGGIVKSLPFLFKKVTGDFIVRDCKLEHLRGSPEDVGGDFIVNSNNLLSLKGGPKYVGGYYDCHDNVLTSLEGAPSIIRIDFNCAGNFLPDLRGAPKKVKGVFDCTDNPLMSMDGKPECDNIMTDFKGEIKKEEPKNEPYIKKFRDEGDGKWRW